MLRRVWPCLGLTNRYFDGSNRTLDGAAPPQELHVPAISNRAYPRRGEHWQLAVADEQLTPHKGDVIVAGGGVVGLTIASLFALRGWHTTVVERAAAYSDDNDNSSLHSNSDVHAPSLRDAVLAARHARGGDDAALAVSPRQLPYALVTRRAADVLTAAGVPLPTLRACGVVVDGVHDHPGDYHSWLTRGLVEQHAFAARLLAVDLHRLRCVLERHVAAVGTTAPAADDTTDTVSTLVRHNLRVFHQHVIEAVYPLRQELVLRAREDSSGDNDDGPDSVTRALSPHRLPTSLTLSEPQWQQRYADDAVPYDLLVCADGVTSRLRSLLDVEGCVVDAGFVTHWFVLHTRALCHRHVHRWLYRARTTSSPSSSSSSFMSSMLPSRLRASMRRALHHNNSSSNNDEHDGDAASQSSSSALVADAHVDGDTGDMTSAAAVSMCCAFPRVEDDTLFAVMAYMPAAQLRGLDDDAVLRTYLRDVVHADPAATLCSFAAPCAPAPTVFCEELHNSVGLPSAVLVGDAAHHCHPFWLQGLAAALEDGATLLNGVDAYSRDCYDAVRQYSNERGTNGDALRVLTERCLYYQRHKHRNVLLRGCNEYRRLMHAMVPTRMRRYDTDKPRYHYARSIEQMLNGRAYTSYAFAEEQQARHAYNNYIARLYT